MTILKPPEIGGAVFPHDDSTFLYTEPKSAVGLWLPLEDCDVENGCLSFVPGSHKKNPVVKRLVRAAGGGTEMIRIPGRENEPEVDWMAEDVEWVSMPVEVGDLVLIHGSVIHRSERNLSQRSRYIYTFHIIEGPPAVWDEKNW